MSIVTPDQYADRVYQHAARLLPWYLRIFPKSAALHFIKCGFLAGAQALKLDAANRKIQGLQNLKEALETLKAVVEHKENKTIH